MYRRYTKMYRMSAHGRRLIYDSHHVSSYTTSHFWLIAYGHERRNPNKSSTSYCLHTVAMMILMGNIRNQDRQGRSQVIITHWISNVILLLFSHYDNLHYLFNLYEVGSIYDVKQFWYLLWFVVKYPWLFFAWMSTHIGRQIVFNSCPPTAAYMRQCIGSALVQILACRLFGAKPLPKPVLGYCKLEP